MKNTINPTYRAQPAQHLHEIQLIKLVPKKTTTYSTHIYTEHKLSDMCQGDIPQLTPYKSAASPSRFTLCWPWPVTSLPVPSSSDSAPSFSPPDHSQYTIRTSPSPAIMITTTTATRMTMMMMVRRRTAITTWVTLNSQLQQHLRQQHWTHTVYYYHHCQHEM